jgi:4-amino-4-deoxy-L-arabinose transferase-like glycosyltransferase
MTKNPVSEAAAGDRTFWIVFAALTIFVYFFGLWIPLLGPDEPRYAQVAREMFTRGDWITPTLGGFNWFEKPALLYWLQIVSYNLFGVSEFSARFGSAVFGLGTIASVYVLARAGGGPRAARLAALVAATSLGILVFSRGASFDIVLTFPVTASLACFFIFDKRSRAQDAKHLGLPLAGFYLFAGIAMLAKGLVGIVFPLAIVGVYQIISLRLPHRALFASLLWGTALASAAAGLWYLPMYLRHGHAFIDEFFIQHHFQRYTSNKYQHPQPFHFFFWVLPLMTIPWIPAFLLGIWRSLEQIRSRESSGEADLARLALAWVIVPLLFFSASGSKLPGYILPCVPAAAILAAAYIGRWEPANVYRTRAVKTVGVAMHVIIVAAVLFAVPYFASSDTVKWMLQAADRQGYREAPVAGYHTISHNAEFYAAGRILRNDDGTQKRLNGPLEVRAVLNATPSGKLLLIAPSGQGTGGLPHGLDPRVLADNGELQMIGVSQARSTMLGSAEAVH